MVPICTYLIILENIDVTLRYSYVSLGMSRSHFFANFSRTRLIYEILQFQRIINHFISWCR